MSVIASSTSAIQLASQTLSEGFLVSIPSETVYGLGADATNPAACQKIFEVKGRPLVDPLILHIQDHSWLDDYAHPNQDAFILAEKFWPGPLTIILPKKDGVSDLLTAGLPTAAFRSPNQKTFQQILASLGRPIAAPSANPFGYLSPTSAQHVEQTLGASVSMIIDDGPCLHGIESTIVDLSIPDDIRLLRPGPISLEEIGNCLGKKVTAGPRISNQSDQSAQVSPGLLSQHYSPHTPLQLFESTPHTVEANDAVVYAFRPELVEYQNCFWLSEKQDWKEVAHHLFNLLYKLDQQNFSTIHIQSAADSPLASAINNRLQRAAAKRK